MLRSERTQPLHPFVAHLARRELPQRDIDHLARLAARSTALIAAREDIVGERADASRIHILLEGWSISYRLLSDGRRQVAAIHLPGDVCDVDALAPARLSFGVLALTDCRIACIERDALKAAMQERVAVRNLIVALLAAENASLFELVVNLGRRSARERIAFLLCRLLGRLQTNGEALNNSIRCALTQTDLGDHLGLSTVHVNRALKDLKLGGLISGRGSVYTISDLPGLQAIAGF